MACHRTQLLTQGVALGWYEAGRWPGRSRQHKASSMGAVEDVANDKR